MEVAASYEVAGVPDGRPIVLVHGMRLTRHMWQPQMQLLADRFRLMAVDLPGHGALAHLPFTLSGAAARLAEVMDRESSGPALVVGLSLGGYVAMEFGARYPRKAAGLVMASATVEPTGWHTVPYRCVAAVMEKAPEGMLARINRLVFEIVYGGERAKPLIEPGFFMRGGSEGLREVFGKKFCPRVAGYPGPTLILNGALDLGFRMHEARFLAAARNGRKEIIPRAFHLCNIDQPERFSDAIRRFAETLSW